MHLNPLEWFQKRGKALKVVITGNGYRMTGESKTCPLTFGWMCQLNSVWFYDQ
jgi:hypothetical protein